MAYVTRRSVLAGASVALAGCLGSAGGDSDAGPPLADEQLPLQYDLDELADSAVSGGPPKDGIPSIDEPSFRSADEADDELDPDGVVFGVVRNGEVKAYPQRILVHHEICNDRFGDEPVSVTYCPLTGTVMGFERGDTEFGVSGDLVNDNLVMYDRATDSRWPQMLATATSGELRGRSLREFRVFWTSWQVWRDAHPDTTVLSTDTGHARNYHSDPYGSYAPKSGYYDSDSLLFPALSRDDRFHPKRVVVGARTDDGVLAVPRGDLLDAGLVAGSVGGVPYVVVNDPDRFVGYAYRNPDGESFAYADGRVRGPDDSHHPADLPLERVYAFDGMWFAWAGFYPELTVLRADG
jgi:hypothetical protein